MDTIYVGIDTSKEKFDACVVDFTGQALLDSTTYKQNTEDYAKFLETVKTIGKILKSQILFGIESTGIYHISLYDYLKKQNYTVRIFNGLETRGLRKTLIRKTKTDPIDARLLANYLRWCMNVEKESPVPMNLKRLNELVRMRARLVKKQSIIKNQLIRDLDLVFPGLSGVFSNILSKFSKELLKRAITPKEMLELNEELEEYVPKKKADLIREIAKKANSPEYMEDIIKYEIRSLIRQSELIFEELEDVTKIFDEEYKKLDNPIKTIGGIGQITGLIIVAKIGDITKFENGSKIAAFAGLDPVIKSSGKLKIESHISKRGDRELRTALYQAAFVGIRCNPVLKQYYEKRISRGRKHQVAVIDCARKLCDIIYSVWSRNKPFEYPYPPTQN